MSPFSKTLFVCAATLATVATFGATVTPAYAQPSDVVVTGERNPLPTAVVKYGHLNLLSASGQRALRHEVAYAVNSLCPLNGTVSLFEQIEIRNCRTFAWSGAQPQIDTAIQRARFNNSLTSINTAILVTASR